MELGQLQERAAEIGKRGIRVVGVTVDPPAVSERFRARLGTEFTFLADEEGVVMDRYGVRHRGGNGWKGKDVPMPTQVLVDRAGVVRWVAAPANFRLPPDPDEVLAAIGRLAQP